MHDLTRKAYVGVTDGDWYRLLAARPTLNEVNFWRPSGSRGFRMLTPVNRSSSRPTIHTTVWSAEAFAAALPAFVYLEAWEFFGQANGTPTLTDMRQRVAHYRRHPLRAHEDPESGCIFVRDVVFLPPDSSADPPPDFAPNIVQGKSYDLANLSTRSYFEELLQQLLSLPLVANLEEPWHRPGPTYGEQRLVPQRLGHRSFQAVVLEAYGLSDLRCNWPGHAERCLAGKDQQ